MDRCREGDGASPSKKEDSSETLFPELLNFACRAQTLISELLILSARIPPEFVDPRYDPVLFDLRYFDSPHDFEARIDGNAGLEELEDQLRESCSVFMQRFFLLANGIVVYHQELLKYLNDLQEGMHVKSTLERVIENEEGRQLLTESLALFGCLLLLMEHHMSGSLREKLLVAHLRHDRCFDAPNLEVMCLLCRVHPSNTSGSLRQVQSSRSGSVMVLVQKPEDLFMRFPFPKQVLDSVLSCLKDCDLYNRILHYPDPEHCSVALASQAGYLYILLFYLPVMLHNEFVMREIVDRFFRDSLVVPIFMYFTVDLSLSWDTYKGAKASLSSCLMPSFIHDQCQLHYMKVNDLMSELCSALSNRVLNRDYVLNNSQSLLALVRNCNVSLRWLLLHRTSNNKKVRDTVISAGTAHQIEEEALLSFLLKTSQFEFEVNQLYTELMESKGTLWQESKGHASESMQELSEYFSGSRTLSWKIKDENLMDLFKSLCVQA
ncbi:WASH complex [Macleaya cordata]|uniref:WASH complex n=1 Tax=Macleaya cordata TaxID=56857 RepID=A0A200QGX5_MACCD|nr:WASH complex [Macleaya cordata]